MSRKNNVKHGVYNQEPRRLALWGTPHSRSDPSFILKVSIGRTEAQLCRLTVAYEALNPDVSTYIIDMTRDGGIYAQQPQR